MTEYTLIRSRRKTIGIYVTKDSRVVVRAPLKTPEAEIGRVVADKSGWISKHLSARAADVANRMEFSLDYGGMVLLLGKEYPLTAKAGSRAGFDGERFFLPPGLTPEEIRGAVIQVYRAIAKNRLRNKAASYADIMGVAPAAVKINGAKTRWGSCSGRNSLNFSWRLIMADEDAVNYVVAHELAHIREHNHSDRFWAIVADVMPDYKERRAKLRTLQRRLAEENWD